MNNKTVKLYENPIPFYTPLTICPAEYTMNLTVSDTTLTGTLHIEWRHEGKDLLQTLQIKGGYTALDVPSHRDCKVEKDENITLIILSTPLHKGEKIIIDIDFSAELVASPFCDGDGSVLMPKNHENEHYTRNIWYPMLTWDIPICGHYTVKVDEPEGYLICATGHKNRNIYSQEYTRVFGLLFCKGLEYMEHVTGDVTIKAFFKSDNKIAAKRLIETSADAINYYKELIGFYPQRSYSFLPYSSVWGGGGNWSTGIAFFHSMHRYNNYDEDKKPWIAAHEICHHYWGEYIPDGDYCGWLWIGLGMMMDEEYSLSRGITDVMKSSAASVISYRQKGNDTTIWQSVEGIKESEEKGNDYNSIIRHDKSFCIMQMLKQVISKDTLFRVMKRILREYPGQPLRTMDFWRICEEESGMRLDWFFIDCLYSNRLAGYEISSIKNDGEGTKARVNSFGDFKFPLYINGKLPGGSIVQKQLNRLMNSQTVCFDVNNVADISIDTGNQLLVCTEKASILLK